MKEFENTPKKWLTSISAIGLLCLLFSSCLKNNNTNYNPPVAYLTFIQASPDGPPLNLVLNNNMVNTFPINFGDNIDYFRAFAGVRTVTFNNAALMSQIRSDTINLVQNQTYTLFLANIAAHPQILLLNDTLNKPPAGDATVRFVNLGPDAPTVDFAIQGGAKMASNKSFKGYSSFIPVTANTNITFQVLQAGTATVLVTLPNVTLNPGFVYTIWLGGLANTVVTGEKLGINVVTNAVFN